MRRTFQDFFRFSLLISILGIQIAGAGEPNAFGEKWGVTEVLDSKVEDSRWALRGLVGFGTSSRLLNILAGDFEKVSGTTVYSLELSYLIKENVMGLPINFSVAGAEMLHLSDKSPTSAFQTNLYIKLEWTDFWWDDHLRTKFGIGEGLSFVDRITYSETVRRDGRGSKRALNYLDISLSLNARDLAGLARVDEVFGADLESLENTWLVLNVSHRSGVFGLFGDYTDSDGTNERKRPIKGGDNILMLGLTHGF